MIPLLDKDKIKESLSESDVKLILNKLNSNDPRTDNQGNPIFQTVCHHGNKHKLYYYRDSQIFKCYTDCGDGFDIFELICRNKKISFYESVKFVAECTGKRYASNNNTQSNSHLISDWNRLNKFTKKLNKETIEEPQLPHYNPHILEVFLDIIHWSWADEGISFETCQKFNIGYYLEEDRITIPHFDIDGNLVGVRGRTTIPEEEENGRKYMPVKIQNEILRHQTALNLYGLHKTKDAIQRLKKAMILESEKSVLFGEEYYGEDNFTVALGGGFLSQEHINLLLSLDIKEVFLAFDKDFHDPDSKEAEKQEEKVKKLADKLTPYVTVWVLWDYEGLLDYKDSPIDKGKETLEELMRNKIEIVTEEE